MSSQIVRFTPRRPPGRARLATGITVGVLAVIGAGCGGGLSSGGSGAAKSAAGCTPHHKVTTLQPGTLTVAAFEFPPYDQIDGAKFTGIDGDIITAIAKMECLSLKIMKSSAASAIPSVTSRRADAAVGVWYRTAQRAKIVSLGQPIYLDQMAVVSSGGSLATIDQLRGRRVGTLLGNLWDDDLKKVVGGGLHLYQQEADVYQDLAAGRLDAVVDSFASAEAQLKRLGNNKWQAKVPPSTPDVVATQRPGQVQFPTSKSNAGLQAAFNADVAAMRRSGALTKVLVRYGLPASAAHPGKPDLL